jgi:peptidoglycan/LPS O-acetylase OafA/YrhL
MKAIPNFEEFQSQKHFLLLDGIRAIAILAVLWHHSSGQTLSWELFDRGYLGVDLFFVLSGFLITHLLIKEERTKGSISLSKFYARRTLRIFPLYYGYLLALLSWKTIAQSPDLGAMLSSMPYYLFYISNWMPSDQYQFFHRAWSLAVEEQFYIVWPALVLIAGFFRSALLIAIILIISLLCALGLFGTYAYDINQLLVPYRTILLGCLLAIALNTKAIYEKLAKICKNPFTASILLIATVGLIGLQSGPIMGIAQFAIHILMAGFLMTCVINEDNYLMPLLSLGWVKIMGIVSYGIYILHGQLWGPTKKILSILPNSAWSDSRLMFFLVFTVLSTLVAYISFNTYERFFLKLKKNYEVK